MAVTSHPGTFRQAVWLGWQVEANWAHPLLFAIYSLIKPIASCMILVVIYSVVTGGRSGRDLFSYMFVGNSFFMLIIGSLMGLSMVLHIEREHYQTLKYVYLATSNLYIYLFGRGVARMTTTACAVLITLLFGRWVLRLPLHLGEINFPLLIIALLLGLIGIVSFGLILAAISMKMAMHNFIISEAAAGLFYFLSGVLYPLSVLPPLLQKVALVLPFTYWMEVIRRAILPHIPPDRVMALLSTGELLLIHAGITALLFAVSLLLFHYLEKETRAKGTFDMTTAY